jgi:hypothetical protein
MKYDGIAWVNVGDPTRFTRGVTGSFGASIAFDSAGMPCVAYPPFLIVRYNGTSWDQISGMEIANLGLGEIKSDRGGNLFTETGRLIYRYQGDTTWTPEDTTGLFNIDKRSLLFAIGPTGIHYAEYYNSYSQDSTNMYQYVANRWVQMGQSFPPNSGLFPVFSASGMPYALYSEKSVLLRFNGIDWVALDSSGLQTGNVNGSSRPASNVNGHIYAATYADTSGKGARVMMYDTHQDDLAVAAPTQAGEVSVLPIPATQTVFIRNTSTAINGRSAIITDVWGRRIFQFVLAATQYVDISAWSKGVYFLHLPSGQVMKLLKE